jgi:predicted cupin superfamily sugar epimerase
MSRTAAANGIIAALGLQPLAGEGGFYRQTWRNDTASAIYFLVTPENFSALHRIAQDELWHFYAGDRVEHVQLDPRDQTLRLTRMGPNVLAGEHPQLSVPAGTWQGARLEPATRPGYGFALLGCTVSPPWDERGFTLGPREELLRAFPAQTEFIRALTR